MKNLKNAPNIHSYSLIKSTTFQLNPAVAELDVQIHLPIQMLETQGWDFEKYHENAATALELSIDDARDYNYRKYEAVVIIEGNAGSPKTSIKWYNPERNEDTEREATGDDAQTIKDIISLLEEEFITIDSEMDYSVDENEIYVPSFVATNALTSRF